MGLYCLVLNILVGYARSGRAGVGGREEEFTFEILVTSYHSDIITIKVLDTYIDI